MACTVSDHVMRCGQAVGPIDVAIALEHIALQATELGLATCWIGSFYPDKVRPILGIPDSVIIVELLALGYPADTPKAFQTRAHRPDRQFRKLAILSGLGHFAESNLNECLTFRRRAVEYRVDLFPGT